MGTLVGEVKGKQRRSVAYRYNPPPRRPAIGIGVLPNSQQLEKTGIQVENPIIGMENQLFVEDQPVVDNSGVPPAKASEGRPQLFLAASGLPTIPQKMAQRIWELDFVETEEFFPSTELCRS